MKPKNRVIAPLELEKFVSQNIEDRFQSGRKIINANQIANIYLQENTETYFRIITENNKITATVDGEHVAIGILTQHSLGNTSTPEHQ